MPAQVFVLGTAQDGGIPHPGCLCATCRAALVDLRHRRRVVSIAVMGRGGRVLLVDATPDLPAQTAALAAALERDPPAIDALLLTHAHAGHVMGLAYLGREAMDVRGLPLYASARMARYLAENRPWTHLLERGNVRVVRLEAHAPFAFDGLEIAPFASVHRDEDTDTLGLEIRGPARRLVYVPDADRFPEDVVGRIRDADVALVDGTFFAPGELPGRDPAEVPHPFVEESVRVLAGARGEVWFTHVNHTNPLVHPDPARRPALPPGFAVLPDGARFPL